MKISHWHNPNRTKACAMCRNVLNISEFSAYKYVTNQGANSVRYESRCRPCNRKRRAERYATPELKEIDKKTSLQWKHDNKEHLASYQKKKQQTTEYKALKSALQRNRKARIRAGTVEKDCSKIKEIYKEAIRLEKETGIKYHVDHIIPLKHGGLHIATNLQILTATENLKKGASLTRLAISGGSDA